MKWSSNLHVLVPRELTVGASQSQNPDELTMELGCIPVFRVKEFLS